VRDAKLEFKNSHAAQDAFGAVLELMDDDETELTEDHVKQLVKEREYYFGKLETVNINSNDSRNKGRSDKTITTQQAIATKRKSL
jgi:hypothetical protein